MDYAVLPIPEIFRPEVSDNARLTSSLRLSNVAVLSPSCCLIAQALAKPAINPIFCRAKFKVYPCGVGWFLPLHRVLEMASQESVLPCPLDPCTICVPGKSRRRAASQESLRGYDLLRLRAIDNQKSLVALSKSIDTFNGKNASIDMGNMTDDNGSNVCGF